MGKGNKSKRKRRKIRDCKIKKTKYKQRKKVIKEKIGEQNGNE